MATNDRREYQHNYYRKNREKGGRGTEKGGGGGDE